MSVSTEPQDGLRRPAGPIHPRVRLAHLPTPLEPMDNLAGVLGKPAGTLFVKRDDATGLAAGGNKVRKLEYVLADAQAKGATWLVTGAGVQSNAARATAAAAAKLGMGCTLVLDGDMPETRSGNLALDDILGAEVRFWPSGDFAALEEGLLAAAADLERTGQRPYVVPVGASTPLGSLGYVDCADELTATLAFEAVVVATGSAGTHAGLIAGLGDATRVCGVQVGVRRDIRTRVRRLAEQTAALAGRPAPVGEIQLDETQLGAGYAAHTAEAFDAITLAARTEGLILDPVYTGKAMASLIAGCRSGRWPADAVLVFVHTGGMPGLLSVNHAGAVAEFARRSPTLA